MNASKIVLLACALQSLVVGKSSAQIIDYSINGTFGSSVPSTLVSAPNATFDIQFSLQAQQPPNPYTNAFDAFFTDESYALNGQTIFSGQSSRASFGMGPYTPTDTLDVYLPAQYNDGFFFNAFETLFSGSVGHPTLIPASFDFPYAGFSNGFGYILANAHVTATAAVPEPPPLALAGTATFLCASCLLFRQRRKRSSTAEQVHAPDGDIRWQARLQIV